MRDVRPLLQPFTALAGDHDVWNHTLDGLAVLGEPDVFRVYLLHRPVPELAIAADSFHLKPLLCIVQSADRDHVLGPSRDTIELFEGNRDVLDESEPAAGTGTLVEKRGVPRTITEALGEQLTEPHVTITPYRAGAGAAAMRYGHGSRRDEVDSDTERCVRAADRAVTEKHSQLSQLPLLIAALPEHHAVFRRVTHNPFLIGEAIDTHPDSISLDTLRERAWSVMQPRYRARLADLVGTFQEARVKGRGANDVTEVAAAVVAGRVAMVLVDAGRRIGGRIDRTSGQITVADLRRPDVDDLLDDLGELVLTKKGQVVVVPTEMMPSTSGAAAIFRF
jgi:hypothetical protein